MVNLIIIMALVKDLALALYVCTEESASTAFAHASKAFTETRVNFGVNVSTFKGKESSNEILNNDVMSDDDVI